jgi:hypothetical protein
MEHFEPSGRQLVALLQVNALAAIKLAPATEMPTDMMAEVEQEWISRDGECKQQVAWFGRGNGRRATVLDRYGDVLRTVRGEPRAVEPGPAMRYVCEPDAAILAAKLEGALAAEHGLKGLGGGYLTGDRAISDGGMATFEAIEVMPFDRKRIAAWLARRGIGKVEVKCRDGRSDANRIQRELTTRADGSVTILLAPARRSTIAIVAKRVGDETQRPK